MKAGVTVVAVVALFAGLAAAAAAQEEPVTLLALEEAVAAPAPECDTATEQVVLTGAQEPVATSTCNVIDHWVPESCTCSGGWVRERLYQQICCPWGCGSLLSTSSTRCSNKPCV